jgi:hypothetical protein
MVLSQRYNTLRPALDGFRVRLRELIGQRLTIAELNNAIFSATNRPVTNVNNWPIFDCQ